LGRGRRVGRVDWWCWLYSPILRAETYHNRMDTIYAKLSKASATV
jgi:hypothetical protein